MAGETDQGGLAEPVRDALEAGSQLQRELVAVDVPDDELLDRADEVRALASAAGQYAWTAHDREQLDLIVRRLSRVLRRAGRPASQEHSRLQPFRGHNPSFTRMTRDELIDAVQNDKHKPVVGKRLVAGEGEDNEITEKDFAGVQLVDCAFIGWSFDGVDFSGGRLIHNVFQACSFDGADLTETTATTCLFSGRARDNRSSFRVDAARANFSGSYVGGFKITRACFAEAAFSYGFFGDVSIDRETTFEGATFDLAALEGVEARGANFDDVVFVGSSLVRVDFRDALLRRANFSSAKVAGARFEGAKLTDAEFASAYFVALARFDASASDALFSDEDRPDIEWDITNEATGVVEPDADRESTG